MGEVTLKDPLQECLRHAVQMADGRTEMFKPLRLQHRAQERFEDRLERERPTRVLPFDLVEQFEPACVDGPEPPFYDRVHQRILGLEMVVDRRQVDAGFRGDGPKRDIQTVLGDQTLGGIQDSNFCFIHTYVSIIRMNPFKSIDKVVYSDKSDGRSTRIVIRKGPPGRSRRAGRGVQTRVLPVAGHCIGAATAGAPGAHAATDGAGERLFLKLRRLETRILSEGHFYRISARAMRQVLIDHSRGRRPATNLPPELISKLLLPANQQAADPELLLAVKMASRRLRTMDGSVAETVWLRSVEGLTVGELSRSQGREEWRVRSRLRFRTQVDGRPAEAVRRMKRILFGLPMRARADRGADDWPGWRGPSGTGISPLKNLPVSWSADRNIAWKTAVPGKGHSSPIVWGNRIFLTTDIEGDRGSGQGGSEAPHPGQAIPESGQHRRRPQAYAESPLLRRQHRQATLERTVHDGEVYDEIHKVSNYAAATPVTDGKFVYVSFGAEGFYKLDFDGQVIWKSDLGKIDTVGLGYASSPVLFGDTVLVLADQDDGTKSFVAALSAADGRWRGRRRARFRTPGLLPD